VTEDGGDPKEMKRFIGSGKPDFNDAPPQIIGALEFSRDH
jgi:hypothetical protein